MCAAAVDLCDIETGTLMGMHILEPWDMATPCFAEVDTQKKIMIPVAITIGNTLPLITTTIKQTTIFSQQQQQQRGFFLFFYVPFDFLPNDVIFRQKVQVETASLCMM